MASNRNTLVGYAVAAFGLVVLFSQMVPNEAPNFQRACPEPSPPPPPPPQETCTPRPLAIPPFRERYGDFPRTLESLKFERGVELGVLKGEFAESMLTHWPSCKEYHFVDLWQQQQNYIDAANSENRVHEDRMKEALNRTKR
jgi:hypothetical protein